MASKKTQYYAVKRIRTRVAEILVTRVDGKITDEFPVAYYRDDNAAIEAMRRDNAGLFGRRVQK